MQTITNFALLLLLALSLAGPANTLTSTYTTKNTLPNISTTVDSAPSEVVDAFSKSYMHESSGAYEKAIQAIETIYDANSYPMNLRIGWLHYVNGNLRQSETYYQQAFVLAPGSVEALQGYVLPLAAGEKWQEVIAAYQQILMIDPKNTVVNYRLAVIYTEQKEYDLAYPFAKKITALYPFNYDGQLLLAKIEIGRGNIMEAKSALMICLQFNPAAREALDMWEIVK